MNSSITQIPCTLDKFFKYWLQFTAPLHKLQNKDIEVLSFILKKRYELSKVITDDNVIDSYLLSREIRDQMLEESGETRSNFQVTLSKLRKQGVISPDGKINKRFIPNLDNDSLRFELMIIFDIKDGTKQTSSENN